MYVNVVTSSIQAVQSSNHESKQSNHDPSKKGKDHMDVMYYEGEGRRERDKKYHYYLLTEHEVVSS